MSVPGSVQRGLQAARHPVSAARHRSRRRVDAFTVSVDEARRRLDRPGALGQLFLEHEGRLVSKWLGYLEVYERHLAPCRAGFPLPDGTTRPLRLLEIGVAQGGSLQLWRRYFGPDATIFGVDVDPRCARFDGPEAAVRIGSQAEPGFLRGVVAEMGGVDVVIDDGSHRVGDQRRSFDTLFPLLSDGGVYLVEDLHTSYWAAEYGGGYRRPGTFVELAKGLVDGMHAWYYGRPRPRRRRWAKTDVRSICFYDSMVVVEKADHGRPARVNVGSPEF